MLLGEHGHVTYRHAVKGQLAVNFKLVGRRHSSTGVHQGIAELQRTSRLFTDYFFAIADISFVFEK